MGKSCHGASPLVRDEGFILRMNVTVGARFHVEFRRRSLRIIVTCAGHPKVGEFSSIEQRKLGQRCAFPPGHARIAACMARRATASAPGFLCAYGSHAGARRNGIGDRPARRGRAEGEGAKKLRAGRLELSPSESIVFDRRQDSVRHPSHGCERSSAPVACYDNCGPITTRPVTRASSSLRDPFSVRTRGR